MSSRGSSRGDIRGGGLQGSRGGFRGGATNIPRVRPVISKNKNNQAYKKNQEKAHLNALMTKEKSYSLQRLMRDYNEIKNQPIPVAGVSAQPLENDFYEWHGNIKGTAQNIYKGAVLHFKLVFPKEYPVNPPIITLLNESFKHPNVMPGGRICLDMFEKSKESYKGWTSAYTVLSILIQLQSFFLEIDESLIDSKEEKKEILTAVRSSSEFSCKTCRHKGSMNPWPEFAKNENELTSYSMTPTKYLEALQSELVCYHRKTNFEETPLGIGISILKIARTGEIKGILPILDFVSLKAYTKERLRRSMSGEKFTHWFPIYFGKQQDRFLHLCKKSISMICTGTTKKFSAEQVLKVMPKFFTNLISDIVSEKTFSSCRALKILIYVYRICLLLFEVYPNIKDEIEAAIFKFKNEPESRHKDVTQSLGDLLTMLTFSSSHKIEEILESYISEQMDRQIFWILQSLPEFEKFMTGENDSNMDDIRDKVCFKAGIVGNQILLFYNYFIKKILFKDSKTSIDIANMLDSNYCNLSNEKIESHRKELQKILKVDSFKDYYTQLGLSVPTEKELNQKLKASYENSLRKGYHGMDNIRFVPDGQEQIKLLFEKFPHIENLLNQSDKKLRSENDFIWQELVTEKFDIVNRIKYKCAGIELTPNLISKYYEELKYEYWARNVNKDSAKEKNSKIKDMFSYYQNYTKDNFSDNSSSHQYTWRSLFLKLYLEMYIKNFRYIADFKYLYSLLDICKDEIVNLNLFIVNCDGIKSDYNYLRVILSKLTKIKSLNLFYIETVSLKMLKNILKGINNFNLAGGEISSLKIHVENIGSFYSHKDFNILSIIDKLTHLKNLDVSGTAIDQNSALRIRNHLYYFKTIEILNLSQSNVDDTMAKEIADGIMKAKSLQKIYLKGNNMKKGLANILYNLAFQPCLELIDISDNKSADVVETSVALYKLIKMSQSLSYLICRGIPNLIQSLTNEFYYSLGDNSSLQYLDLSESGNISSIANHGKLLGSAIALNALKNGALNTLLLSSTVLDYPKFIQIIDGMFISEETHFQWYGSFFDSSIQKESKEYFNKKFYCKLSHLDFSKNSFNCNVNINDLKNKQTNHLRILLENNQKLESLDFSSSVNNKFFIDMIVNALTFPNGLKYLNLENSQMQKEKIKILMTAFNKENVINPLNKIEALNLAKNNFGYSGIEAISNILKDNKTLRILNLYKNLFDVNGARRLKDALALNNTLEMIEIGYNRIKDLGFTNIIEGISSNPDSKLRYLGCRYNFVKSNCLMSCIYKLKDTKIDSLDISNNSLDQNTINMLYSKLYASDSSISHLKLDIFEILNFISTEKLERSVWISPLNSSINTKLIYDALKIQERKTINEDNSHLGIPLKITIRRGRRVGEKKGGEVVDAFVEFIHPNSTNRLLKIASQNGLMIQGKRVRVYKAGTRPDNVFLKKKKKNK